MWVGRDCVRTMSDSKLMLRAAICIMKLENKIHGIFDWFAETTTKVSKVFMETCIDLESDKLFERRRHILLCVVSILEFGGFSSHRIKAVFVHSLLSAEAVVAEICAFTNTA